MSLRLNTTVLNTKMEVRSRWNIVLSVTASTAVMVYRYIDIDYQHLFWSLAAIHDTCHSSCVTSETSLNGLTIHQWTGRFPDNLTMLTNSLKCLSLCTSQPLPVCRCAHHSLCQSVAVHFTAFASLSLCTSQPLPQSKTFSTWVSNPGPPRLYYAPRAHISKLCICYKSHTIM